MTNQLKHAGEPPGACILLACCQFDDRLLLFSQLRARRNKIYRVMSVSVAL